MSDQADSPEPGVPPRLSEAIRAGILRPDAARLSKLDDAVLGMAHGRVGRRRMVWPRIGGVLAAAAGLAIAVSVAWWGGLGGGRVRQSQQLIAFDPTKPVTILDAFQLSRLLKDPGVRISPTWDVTADGIIDDRDVEAIATRAVRLSMTSAGRARVTPVNHRAARIAAAEIADPTCAGASVPEPFADTHYTRNLRDCKMEGLLARWEEPSSHTRRALSLAKECGA